MKKFPTLYKRAKTGKIQCWHIEVEESTDNIDRYTNIIVTHGQLGGKGQISSEQITSGLNIGKTNETTQDQQAISNAQSKWNGKKDDGYKSLEDLGIPLTDDLELLLDCLKSTLPKSNTDATGNEKPMLAKDWKKVKKIAFPMFIQPKYNGVRCLTMLIDGGITFLSREGKPFTTLYHLEKELKPVFDEYPDLILDGEIYIHNTPLQDIVSYVKAFQLSSPLLEYHIYDLAIDEIQSGRNLLLIKIFETNTFNKVKHVGSAICNSKEEAVTHHNIYVEAGYEGAMLRDPKGLYGFGQRSSSLLKVKEFMEEEFEIVGGSSGRGKFDGCCIFKCKTEEGKVFEAVAPGTLKQKREYFDNLKDYIGKKLTVKYFERTPDNIPFHGNGVAVRDYEK